MSDRDLEKILREQLRQRLTPGEPSPRLFDHVARLGAEPDRRGFGLSFRRSPAAFGGVALVALVAALLMGGLYWRTNIQANPSSTGRPPTPTIGPAKTPTATPTQVTLKPWQGRDVATREFHRLASGFIWVVGTIGDAAILFTSSNDGQTWSQQALPEAAQFVTFTDPSHAFAVSSTPAKVRGHTNSFLRSDDGGKTWTRSLIIDHSGFQMQQLDMIDSLHGWVTMADIRTVFWLWGTSDGGSTWFPLVDTSKWAMSAPVPPPNTPPAPRSVRFLSADDGWGWSRDGEPLHSLDGGKSWKLAHLPDLPGTTTGITAFKMNGDTHRLVLYALTATPSGDQLAFSWQTLTSSDGGISWIVGSSRALGSEAPNGSDTVFDPDGNLSGFGRLRPGEAGLLQAPASVSLLTPDGDLADFDTMGLSGFATRGSTLIMAASAFSTTEAWVSIDTCVPPGPMSGIFIPCPRLAATFDAGKTWQPVLWKPSPAASPSPSGTNP